MDVVSNNYMPGDPRLIDEIVNELKSQGIFDNFRKECIADVDTKPAYQNLRQRVEGTVLTFLKSQRWRPDLNKNHVRELLRKNIYESGFLEIGVERIVDQVVNPKVNTVFLSKVEEVVYKYLGIQKPNRIETNITRNGSFSYNDNLLPNDLEAISPDSEVLDKCLNKLDRSTDSDKLDDSKIDEDESPPFEPIEVDSTYLPPDESSMDSHLSGISGLISHDSNSNNNETQMSKISSESRLSIVTSPDNDVKMDISEDSTTQMSKCSKNGEILGANLFNFDFQSFDTGINNKIEKEIEEKKSENKDKKEHRRDSERSKHKHSDLKEKREEVKEKKDDSKERKDEPKDKKIDTKERRDESKDKKDDLKEKKEESKEKKDESKEKKIDIKDKKDESKERKDEKRLDKDKKHSSTSSLKEKDKSNSKDKSKDSKSKDYNSSKNEKDKDSNKSRSSSSSKHKSSSSSSSSRKESSHSVDKPKSSSKSKDSKSKTSIEFLQSKEVSKSSSNKSANEIKSKSSSSKDDKYHSKNERHDKKSDKRKENGKKEIKDDHYSWKSKKTSRRSTDRDSNDGHSNAGTNSMSSLLTESSGSLPTNNVDSSSNSAASGGNSDEVNSKNLIMDVTTDVSDTTEVLIASDTILEPVKLIKPRFASNIFEARRLMKIRKKMEKIQQKMQQQYVQNVSTNVNKNNINSEKAVIPLDSLDVKEKDQSVNNAVISKESWDAIEAKLSAVVDYNSYNESDGLNKEFLNTDESSASNELPSFLESSKLAEDNAESTNNLSMEDNRNDFRKDSVMSSKSSDEGEDLKYLSPRTSPKTQRFLEHVANMQEQSLNVIKSRRTRKPNMKYCSSDFDSEMTFSTESISDYDLVNSSCDNYEFTVEKKKIVKKPVKRKADKDIECDSDNNNKKINSRLEEPSHAEMKVEIKCPEKKVEVDIEQNTSTTSNETKSGSAKSKIRPISKVRKSKRLDTPPVHIDSFPMPLSPAESDVSASSLDMKRVSEDPEVAPPKIAKSSGRGQRYSSDDLYKPRPTFLGSRRRNPRNKDTINDNTL